MRKPNGLKALAQADFINKLIAAVRKSGSEVVELRPKGVNPEALIAEMRKAKLVARLTGERTVTVMTAKAFNEKLAAAIAAETESLNGMMVVRAISPPFTMADVKQWMVLNKLEHSYHAGTVFYLARQAA